MASELEIFQEAWIEIESAIHRLIELLAQLSNKVEKKKIHPFTMDEYSRIYQVCYELCVRSGDHNHPEALYLKHSETFANYLQEGVLPTLKTLKGDTLLVTLIQRWKEHEVMTKWMHLFFRYIDRYYVKQSSVPSLKASALNSFRTHIYDQMSDHFVRAVLQLIEREREGDLIDQSLLHDCLNVFVALSGKPNNIQRQPQRENLGSPTWRVQRQIDVYTSDFEAAFLKKTEEFFIAKAKNWLQTLPSGDFLRAADNSIKAECERAEKFLQPSSKAVWLAANPDADLTIDFDDNSMGTLPRLLKVLRDCVLAKNATEVLNKPGSGLKSMLEEMKNDDLKLLFSLYKDVEEGLDPVAYELKRHVIAEGQSIDGGTSKTDDVVRLVSSFVLLHDKYEDLVNNAFDCHPRLSRAMKEAFEEFLNEERGEDNKVTFAELLSTYVDAQLKSKKVDEVTREGNLDRAVKLFLYLQEKDRFGEIYRGKLSKRLLNSLSADPSLETRMISKLKANVGAGYTNRMEGMVKDLNTGKMQRERFQTYVVEQKLGQRGLSGKGMVDLDGIEFGVDKLTTGWWPDSLQVDLTYPEEMKKCMEIYESFYSSAEEYKKLTWKPSLGSIVMKARLGGLIYELTLTTLQAACLMLFNGSEPLHFAEVQKRLGLDVDITKKVLHSFLRVKILEKQGGKSSNKIDPESDVFNVNDKFKDKKTKVKVPLSSLEKSHNPQRMKEERKEAIEAAIVRIMKTRKQMEHNQLVGEVLTQLHYFRPEGKQVKARIESLIERDFLERDEENPQLYSYLA